MKLLNLMLSPSRGGIEQAFLDYDEALRLAGHEVTPVVYPGSWAAEELNRQRLPFFPLHNFGEWDPFASYRLRRLITRTGARAIIAHGNRAIGLSLRAGKDRAPIIGVAHNYNLRRFPRLSAAFAITQDLAGRIEALGLPQARIFHIPNMIRPPQPTVRMAYRTPPVIGALGRFVAKKGFEVYLDALAILHQRGLPFHAVLAGDGEERERLLAQSQRLGLDGIVSFPGWVADKQAFYENIDLFCLPSHHEPFGIVLLEAFAYGVPTVTTDSEGPREIASHERNALIVPKANPAAMADALARLLSQEQEARMLAEEGQRSIAAQYALPVVAEKISAALLALCEKPPT